MSMINLENYECLYILELEWGLLELFLRCILRVFDNSKIIHEICGLYSC